MNKKKIYYTIEKELQDVGGIEETTGNKTVTTYEIDIVKKSLEKLFQLDLLNEDNSKEAIEDYISDNKIGDGNFELILL